MTPVSEPFNGIIWGGDGRPPKKDEQYKHEWRLFSYVTARALSYWLF